MVGYFGVYERAGVNGNDIAGLVEFVECAGIGDVIELTVAGHTLPAGNFNDFLEAILISELSGFGKKSEARQQGKSQYSLNIHVVVKRITRESGGEEDLETV